MRIGTIVEGPTDRLMIKAIVDAICLGEHQYFDLQPADVGDSFGEPGGWKRVRRFCQDIWQNLNTNVSDFIIDYDLDLLLIHVDADVVEESDLQEGIRHPIDPVIVNCPPIEPAINRIHEVIARWLNLLEATALPSNIILVVPAQDSENWIFAGLFPDDGLCQNDDYECVQQDNSKHPAFCLSLKKYEYEGIRLRRTNGRVRKTVSFYRHILPVMIDHWVQVCEICTQAQRFHARLKEL